ncbi:MAG: HEAT repeat domain-containing protein [Bryobacterales bacterium]|nr:HEAT repeat domain-containing protein [Bryobacterales bacterium]
MKANKTILLALLGAGMLAAQPKIGVIEIFGAKKTPRDKIVKALGALDGDPLPSSKVESEGRIELVPGILRATIEAVCCEGGRAILYVGVEEKGSESRFEYNSQPSQELRIPEEIENEWMEFIGSLNVAVQSGKADEDLTQGHSLMADAGVRKSQIRFLEMAGRHLDLLRNVLRNSEDEQQRGIAAFVLQYGADKKQVAADLQHAMRDPDSTVRNNAMRGLAALAVFAQLNPQSELKISPTWFIEMLNSTHFTDRNKASLALMNLTEKRDQNTMQHMQDRAVPALMEMAQWKSLGHALPGFILLGRLVGWSEDEIHDKWKQGARQQLLQLARDLNKKK